MVIEEIIELYINGLSLYKIQRKNEDKILIYLRYWLSYFEYIYINDKELSNKIISNNIALYQIKYNKTYNKENLLYHFIFKLLKIVSPIKYFKIGILPGGRSSKILSKLSHIFLKAELRNFNFVINKEFKSFFINNLENILIQNELQYLIKLIPDILFSNTILNNSNVLPSIYRGSPACLMSDNYLYLSILFSNKTISLIGIQHGGGYSEWKNRTSEKMEKDISNLFYSWSFNPPLINQNRFKINYKSKKNHIIWIGREITLWNNTNNFYDDAEDHFKKYNHVNLFLNKLINYGIYFLPHPNNKIHDYNNLFKNCLNITKNNEFFIQNSKLVIFDCLSHTLLYRCLHSKIPFIILLSEMPKFDLSNNSLNFYQFLKNNNLLFEMKDVILNDDNFIKKVERILLGKEFKLDKDLENVILSFFLNQDITNVTANYSDYNY
jgi:hypothetical protein